MDKIINWLKNNWFLWLFLLVFYILLRIYGLDIMIYDTQNFKLQKLDRSAGVPADKATVVEDSVVGKGIKPPRFLKDTSTL